MMSASPDKEERLAEILREILTLSGTKRPSHSKSTVGADSVKLFDTKPGNGIHQIRTPSTKQGTRSSPVTDSSSE
jgi:hypothetical protein